MKHLRDIGNSVIVVEHDREMIESSDFVVDLGPKAGEHGGEVVAFGKPQSLNGNSTTSDYIKGIKKIEIPTERRKGKGLNITLKGASGNNLKDVDLKIPLGKFICITGVSGSGKSTLINETLYRILSRQLSKGIEQPLPFKSMEGLSRMKNDRLEKIVD